MFVVENIISIVEKINSNLENIMCVCMVGILFPYLRIIQSRVREFYFSEWGMIQKNGDLWNTE